MIKTRWWWYVLPFALLHLPFAFSPMCVWDSAVQQQLYSTANFSDAKNLFFDSGVPISYFEMIGFASLPYPVFMLKMFSIVVMCSSSLVMAAVLEEITLLSSLEIYFISVGAFFFPSYSMWSHIIMSPYYFSLLMYLIAILLYLKKKSIFIITPILVISFNIQSFLPITYALLLINYVYRHQHALREKIISYVLKNAILLLIPIAYYLSIRYFFPLAGFYKVDGYNTFNISISSLFRNFSISIVNTTLTPFYLLGKYALSDFISLFPIALISAAIAYIMFKTRLLATVPAIIQTKRHLGFSILLLLAATFPYALVNKHVTTFGYETRHSLLMIIPTLLIIVVMARYFGKYQALFFLLFSFLSITIYLKNQLLWENRYIKYQAIIYQLQKQPLLDNANNFFFTEKNKHFEMPEYLRFYECNILLKEAYRNESNLGINEESAPHNDSLINAYSQKYITRKKSLCFADYTKTSLQQEIEISDHFAEDIDVFFAYYFGSREALLEKLITLKVK